MKSTQLPPLGEVDGEAVGPDDVKSLGEALGLLDGEAVGPPVGEALGEALVGNGVGAGVGEADGIGAPGARPIMFIAASTSIKPCP